MSRVSEDRIQRQRERAARSLAAASVPSTIKPQSSMGLSVIFGQATQELAPKRQRRTQGVGLAPARSTHTPKSELRARSIPQLLTPAPSAEALNSPARRKAEAQGFADFGKRTWFLVSRGESFRAVESLDDAPGWVLVQEMRR